MMALIDDELAQLREQLYRAEQRTMVLEISNGILRERSADLVNQIDNAMANLRIAELSLDHERSVGRVLVNDRDEARRLARKYFWRMLKAEHNEEGAVEWAKDAQVTIEMLERKVEDLETANRQLRGIPGRCRDCRYWLVHKGETYQGDCTSRKLISAQEPHPIAGDSLVYGGGYGYDDEYLYTMHDFGCVHFAKKAAP